MLHEELDELTDLINEKLSHEEKAEKLNSGYPGPFRLKKVKVANFNLDEFEEISIGDFVTHRTRWSMQEKCAYVNDDICRFVDFILSTELCRTISKSIAEESGGRYDLETAWLYLSSFTSFITAELSDGTSPSEAMMKEAFLKDLSENSLFVTAKAGLKGINIADETINMGNGAILRRVNKTDYHEHSIIIAGSSPNNIGFPAKFTAGSVLELTLKRRSANKSPIHPPHGVEIRWNSTIRSYDNMIQQVIPLTEKWIDALELSLPGPDIRIEFRQIEVRLPNLSPSKPAYRWAAKYQTIDPHTQIMIHRGDRGSIELAKSLVTSQFDNALAPLDGKHTPTSFAYSQYIEILRGRHGVDKSIREEVEALEAYFTPKVGRNKDFINSVGFLLETIAYDKNDTRNILNNAYLLRNAFTHRGIGWDEQDYVKATSDEVRIMWHNYKFEVSELLMNYLRLAVVSRLLSRMDDQHYIDLMNKAVTTKKIDPILSSQKGLILCVLEKITDFVNIRTVAKRHRLSWETIQEKIMKKEIRSVSMELPEEKNKSKIIYFIPDTELPEFRQADEN